jgi:hypothetical protein
MLFLKKDHTDIHQGTSPAYNASDSTNLDQAPSSDSSMIPLNPYNP